jgi:hypothetical protein
MRIEKPTVWVNPAFDPKTNTWYLEDRPEEASTVKELLNKLGTDFRYRMRYYKPEGYNPRVRR